MNVQPFALLDGISSINKGLTLGSVTPLLLPRRNRNREPRPGHLTAVESTYWQYQASPIRLNFALNGTGKDDLVNKYQAIAGWLLNASEMRLWYDPEKYYLGSVEGDIDFEMVTPRWARITVDFICNPPCWHKVRSKQVGWHPAAGTPIPEQITVGTETVSRTNSGDLPSVAYLAAHPAALYFAITGTWTTLAVGGGAGLVINWQAVGSTTLYIDCDAQVVYHKAGGVMTSVPFVGDFPVLDIKSAGAIAVAGENLAATIRLLVIERG
jgi:predicted phage tail component-like protein